MRRIVFASALVAASSVALLWATPARADLIDNSVGVKVMAGGSLWTTPSDRPQDYEGIGFAGNGGGFSYGGGLYGEIRFIKVLSLEVDLLYDKSTIMRNVDYSAKVTVQEKIQITNLRIPVLAKANLPVLFGRLFVLLGPEFVRGSSVDPSLEVTEGNATIQTEMDAETANYTMLTGGLGFTLDVPPFLEIPLELRASKNLDQEDAWLDRVHGDSTGYVVDAQTSWDFRVSAGLGYRF